MHVVKNDTVKILTGKYSGKTGKVLKVFPDQNRLIVEGVNIIKKHTKPSQKNPQGGIIEKESTIHVSNVMVIDPKTNEPTRVGYKFLEDGTKVRISKKSGEMLRS
ncbi:MAG: 50S ribosomal protein L24 [Calditrichia bacterium]|jgi:large subunit ribosomal protein L24|nr:50S ribosomal protein L24 [Calditrichia bacterium]